MLKLRTTAAMLAMATTLISTTALAAPTSQCYTIQGGRVVAVTSVACANSAQAAACKVASASSASNCYSFYNYYTACRTQSSNYVPSSSCGSGSQATVKPTATPAPAATPTPSKPATTTAAPTNASALENAMLSLINDERAKNGLSKLTMDGTLVSLARMKSQDMVTKNYFAHNSPTYGSASDMVKNAGMKAYSVGENLAHHASMEKAHAALMSSTGHRANILGSSYNYVGIGIVSDKNGYPMITQIFVRK